MPHRILEGIEIRRPRDVVWAAFCRLEDWPRWFPALRAVQRSAAGPFTVGERLVLSLELAGRSADIAVEVSSAAGGHVRWKGQRFGVSGDHAFLIEPAQEDPAGARCRFVSDELFAGMVVRFLPRRILDELELATRAGLERFRALVEAREPERSP